MEARLGEIAALFTAMCWTITALAFESAGRKVGSLSVNIIRLFMAFVLLGVFSWIRRGLFLPLDASLHAWFWLALSGLAGFVLGDLFLFKAFTVIGSRLSMLIMTLVPPITTLIGWLLLDERLMPIHFAGMSLTLSGIAMVIFQRQKGKMPGLGSIPLKGLLLAVGGAAGQAGGLVLSKFGMGSYDPFAATHIRVMVGMLGFSVIIMIFRRQKAVISAGKNHIALLLILLGATFGPFLGVSSSLIAVQHTATGIASTIMSITPILIIPVGFLFFRQPVSWKEIVGALVSVGGVALFFL